MCARLFLCLVMMRGIDLTLFFFAVGHASGQLGTAPLGRAYHVQVMHAHHQLGEPYRSSTEVRLVCGVCLAGAGGGRSG